MEALIGTRLTNSMLQQAGANGGASFASTFVPTMDLSAKVAFQSCLHAYQLAGFGQFDLTSLDWPVGHAIIAAQNTFEAWMMRQHNR